MMRALRSERFRMKSLACLVAIAALAACDKGKKSEPSAAPTATTKAAATASASAAASASPSAKPAEKKGVTGAAITADQAKAVIKEMNELCPDTWCEGEFQWTFKTLECQPKKCKLSFSAKKEKAKAAQDDAIEIAYDGEILDASGSMTDPFQEALNKAIDAWETAH